MRATVSVVLDDFTLRAIADHFGMSHCRPSKQRVEGFLRGLLESDLQMVVSDYEKACRKADKERKQ